MSSLKQYYNDTVIKGLMESQGYTNVMQVPRITKITLNMGLGEAVTDKKHITGALSDLALISGQKAVATKARKSIAGFKIRDGWPIGAKVTLRKKRMWDFLERLLFVAIPRVRDFRGLNRKSFDGQGNYSIGITEQLIFPEIEYDKVEAIRGLDITFTTTATNNADGLALLKALNFPIREN